MKNLLIILLLMPAILWAQNNDEKDDLYRNPDADNVRPIREINGKVMFIETFGTRKSKEEMFLSAVKCIEDNFRKSDLKITKEDENEGILEGRCAVLRSSEIIELSLYKISYTFDITVSKGKMRLKVKDIVFEGVDSKNPYKYSAEETVSEAAIRRSDDEDYEINQDFRTGLLDAFKEFYLLVRERTK